MKVLMKDLRNFRQIFTRNHKNSQLNKSHEHKAWNYKRNKYRKIKKYTENLFRVDEVFSFNMEKEIL